MSLQQAEQRESVNALSSAPAYPPLNGAGQPPLQMDARVSAMLSELQAKKEAAVRHPPLICRLLDSRPSLVCAIRFKRSPRLGCRKTLLKCRFLNRYSSVSLL